MKRFLALFLVLGWMVPSAYALTGVANEISVQDGQIGIVDPLIVGKGGTGAATLTDRAVIIGRGTAIVEFASPGAAGQVLRSTGAAANPAFGATDLADTDAVTGVLAIANGGTNALSFTGGSLCIRTNAGNTALVAAAADCAVSGQNLIMFGDGIDITQGTTVFVGDGTGMDQDVDRVAAKVNNGVTVSQMACTNSAIQGVGNNVIITLMQGTCGAPAADVETVCTITGTAGSDQGCTDEDAQAIAAGNCFAWRIVAPGTLTANAVISCSAERTL